MKYSINELSLEQSFEAFLDDVSDLCKRVFESSFSYLELNEYSYDIDKVVEELELDIELVKGFVDEFMIEIFKSKNLFLESINKLQEDKNNGITPDFQLFRDLVHKNLGVAKNLRIKSAEKLLNELMNSDDTEYLKKCLEALNVCAVNLNPPHAYKTLKMLKFQQSV
jgi:hypothetical protein